MAKPRVKNPAPPKARAAGPAMAMHAGWLADPQNRLTLALAVSLFIHALLLSVHFRLPERIASRFSDQHLEVVLVNAKSARKPSDAQALAQANLDGGGNTEENRRAATPLPASPNKQSGDTLAEASSRVQQLERMQQALITQNKVARPSAPTETHKTQQTDPVAQPSGMDLAQSALAIARMEAEVARRVEEYNKRPRRKSVTARTREVSYAMYFTQWRDKVEKVGNLNYPEAAQGRMYGDVLLLVSVKEDGSLENVEIRRSSGQQVLDQAALRIVRLSAPYASFPADMRKEYQILDIAATISFVKGDQVRSQLN